MKPDPLGEMLQALGHRVVDVTPQVAFHLHCTRCGVSSWHPEARMCTAADCSIRQLAEAA